MSRWILPLVVFLAAGFGAGFAAAQTEPSREAMKAARQKVWAFEMPLVQRILQEDAVNPRQAPDVQQAVRAFFAKLNGSAEKIAAIGMLDSRYVYVAPKELAADLLGPLLRDPDPGVHIRAARAVGYHHCGAMYVDELNALLADDPPAETLTVLAYALGRSGHQPFVATLQEWLRHREPQVRAAASSALTSLAPESALDPNLRLLKDESVQVRKAAVQNLAGSSEPQAAEAIERLLDDESHEIRERAVWALGQMERSKSADPIAARLQDPHHRVRGRAAEVLARLHATEHADAVAALLADRDIVARRYAAQAVGRLGLPRHIELLRPLLNDHDEQLRKYTATSLRRLEAIQARGNPGAASDDRR